MIDLHCHILPGIDDGPADLEGALDLAAAAAASGTEVIAATPHLRDDHPRVNIWELADRCVELNRAIAESAIPLRVLPAAEVDLIWACEASPPELRLASYAQAGTDVLIETPLDVLPPIFEKLLFQIRARGYRVVLAHPERNRTFQQDPERLRRLVGGGVVIQVNAGSLTRGNGHSRSRALARSLVKSRLAHIIASDAHNATGWRPPPLGPALAAAAKLDGRTPTWMVSEWPSAILLGEELPRPLSVETRRRSLARRRR